MICTRSCLPGQLLHSSVLRYEYFFRLKAYMKNNGTDLWQAGASFM